MNDTDEWFAFFIGMAVGAAIAYGGFLATRYIDSLTPDEMSVPPGAIVITRTDGTQCVGHVAAPHNFVGTPPRLWICGNDEPPYYDTTGSRIPTQSLGELP